MCTIAVIFPKGNITEAEIRAMARNNPDGQGYAFVNHENKIVIRHFLKVGTLLKKFTADFNLYSKETPFLIHFRIGTHGEKTIENVHPFIVNDSTVMVHNGIIMLPKWASPDGDPRSDTKLFVDMMLMHMPRNFPYNEGIMRMIQAFIGNWNKIVFLTNKRDILFVNREQGEEDTLNKRWFSNDGYKEKTQRYMSYPYASMYDWADEDWVKTIYEGKTPAKPETLASALAKNGHKDVNLFDECAMCGLNVYWREVNDEYGICFQCLMDIDAFDTTPEQMGFRKGHPDMNRAVGNVRARALSSVDID
jgi:predicted glutamine amidotransferase